MEEHGIHEDVDKSKGSSQSTRTPTTAYSVRSSVTENGRIPFQPLVTVPSVPQQQLDEKTSLIEPNFQSKFTKTKLNQHSPRLYVVYGDTDEESEESYVPSNKSNPVRLMNFWASLIAQFLSLPLFVIAIYQLTRLPLTSGSIISCTIAIIGATISLTVEVTHCIPKITPNFLQWRLGRHVLLHTCIASFSAIPYSNKQELLATFFLLHIIPAVGFYVARARRESNLFS